MQLLDIIGLICTSTSFFWYYTTLYSKPLNLKIIKGLSKITRSHPDIIEIKKKKTVKSYVTQQCQSLTVLNKHF